MLSTTTSPVILLVLFAILPGTVSVRAITTVHHVFLRNDFHYLDVLKIGTFTVADVFDCTLQCLRISLCVAVNLASNRGVDGKLWCELLSGDKYINSLEFKGNQTSHHLFKRSYCVFTPCQNGGTCQANYTDDTFKCLCEEGFLGEYCETGATSCRQLDEAQNLQTSQMVTLRFGLAPTSVFCHMGDFGCGNGAWTTVMKTNGDKNTFHYDSLYWGNTNEYNLNGGKTGFDSQETKLPTYWNTPFFKICLGMKFGQQLKFIVINKQANSLYSLIADGQYRATSLGRNTWKTLLGSHGSLQYNCNRQGFNLRCGGSCRTRIGVVSNNENNCVSCDSRLGFGAGGHPDDSNTCGNAAKYHTDNGVKYIKTMGYILVQ